MRSASRLRNRSGCVCARSVRTTICPTTCRPEPLRRWQQRFTLAITRPEAVPGNTLTIDASRLAYTPGERTTDVALTLEARSSQGGQHTITLPEGATLQSATINGVAQPIRQQDRLVTLPLAPGAQSFVLNWREGRGIDNRYRTSGVDLGIASVNASTQVASSANTSKARKISR